MSFDKIFDLTAGVYFHFYNIPVRTRYQLPVFYELNSSGTKSIFPKWNIINRWCCSCTCIQHQQHRVEVHQSVMVCQSKMAAFLGEAALFIPSGERNSPVALQAILTAFCQDTALLRPPCWGTSSFYMAPRAHHAHIFWDELLGNCVVSFGKSV